MDLKITNEDLDTLEVEDLINDEDYFYNHGCDWCNLVNVDGTCSLEHLNSPIETEKYCGTHRIQTISNNGIAAIKCSNYKDMGYGK